MPDATPPLSRRAFLGAAAAAGLLPGAAGADRPTPDAGPGRPRNLILLISDGMSTGVLELADLFEAGRSGGRTAWTDLIAAPGARTGLVTTAPAVGHVTDSAAAGTAFSVGRRAENRKINVLPDGSRPEPMFVRAQRAGFATGLVSTAHLNHATPAAFLVNADHRERYDEIAAGMLERGFDVALGGGTRWFDRALDGAPRRYRVVRDRAGLASAAGDPGPLLGLFSPEHMSYDIDRPETEPSIAEMTRVALRRLDASGGPFVLMVEGARIDHAAHAVDAIGVITDQLAYDAALRVALAFAAGRDDTLVVTTTDHGNSNPGLADYGARGAEKFRRLHLATASMEKTLIRFGARPAGERTAERLAADLAEANGFELTAGEVGALRRVLDRERLVHPYGLCDNLVGVCGSLLANHHGVAFNSTTHTSDHVIATSAGPGSASMPAIGHIADLHDWYAGLLGLGA